MEMHPKCLLDVLGTVCPGWWRFCWFFSIWHVDGVFQTVCGSGAPGSLLQQESLLSGLDCFPDELKVPTYLRGCRIRLEVSAMTSLLYHVGGEDSLQGRQHMFKLKYRIISQTGKGNCE